MTRPAEHPIQLFRFHVDFMRGDDVPLCGGAFSECTGLEATMEPKVIREGGGNYGAVQRAGPVTFATVVLRRGVTRTRDLWRWWELVTTRGQFAHRLDATVNVFDAAGEAVLAWRLEQAMPVKFRAADLNARGTEVGIEELHLVHEGLTLVEPTRPSLAAGGAA